MNADKARAAAQAMAAQHRDRQNMTPLVGTLKPADLDDAIAIQDAYIELMATTGRPIGGWKIALTTPVMQALVGIDHPCPGAIFGDTIHVSPCEIHAHDYVRVAVESEIAVRIGRDVTATAGPLTRDTIGAYVTEAMAGIEIVDDRNWDYDTADARDLVADNSFNFGCVLGAPRADWHKLDLAAVRGRMRIDGEVVGEGCGADVLGHPFEALAWLASHLAERGRGLRTGDVVMMGSVVATRWPRPGSVIVAELDGFEPAELQIS